MNKKLINFPKLISRLWISLWIVLIILVIMKLLFNTWYPIILKNEYINNIFTYLDNKPLIIRVLVSMPFYCFNVIFVYLTTTIKKKLKRLEFLYIIGACISCVLKAYINYLGLITEIILLVVIPIIYNFKHNVFHKKWMNVIYPIIMNVIYILWQSLILIVRNANVMLTNGPFLISVVMQLDYYIFLIITYIGVCHMGFIGVWLFGKSLTELKEIKEKELAKESPDKELIAELDKKIEELEAKGK